ncbi:MAG: TrkA family potassium uptake protein [Opitutales bacterium]|nr:TrkA family potassium uptake protein [Opitutales bacterium]
MKYCVIGLGVFGRNLCKHLTGLGAEVLALGENEETVNMIKDEVAQAQLVKYSDIEMFKGFGLSSMDAIFIALGTDFESSMTMTLWAMTARKESRNQSLKVYARALSETHRKLLELVGVDRVIIPEESAARSLAHSVLVRGALDSYDLGDGYAIIEASTPENFVAKTLKDLAAQFDQYKVLLVTVKRPVGKMQILAAKTMFGRDLSKDEIQHKTLGRPRPDWKFEKDDVLVLMGPEKNLRGFLSAE